MRGRELKLNKLDEKERGYLFGLFEGDGYKTYDKKSRHYHIEFYLNSIKDKSIIAHLLILLRDIGLNPSVYQDKRYNCKRIRVYSKSFFETMKKGITLNNKSNEFCLGFVSGLIDSEGHVNKSKSYIMVVNTNEELLKKCSRFLQSEGINNSISLRKPSKKDKQKSYRMYISVNFKRVKHLSIKAGVFSRHSGVEISDT